MRRLSLRHSHGQVASEWWGQAQTHFSASSFTALSVCHISLGKARALRESKEEPRLKSKPTKTLQSIINSWQALRTTGVKKRGLWSDQVEWTLFPALRNRDNLKGKEGCSCPGKGLEEGKSRGWSCRKDYADQEGSGRKEVDRVKRWVRVGLRRGG